MVEAIAQGGEFHVCTVATDEDKIDWARHDLSRA
jgi:hypothetical protein